MSDDDGGAGYAHGGLVFVVEKTVTGHLTSIEILIEHSPFLRGKPHVRG